MKKYAFSVILVALITNFILAYIIMLLWNWLLPTLFGLITITYWQAFGVLILLNIISGLFKNKSK